MTAVEKIILEIDNELQTLESCHGKEIFGRKVGLEFAKRVAIKAKEMEKEQMHKNTNFICHGCGTKHTGKNDDQMYEVCKQCFINL